MDTRYGLELDAEGICGGCRYYDEMETIDWDARKSELAKIIEDAKKKAQANGAMYDCVVGVSGGKDSTFIACYLKENFDVNILLVNCEPYDITPEGAHNLKQLQSHGFDLIKYSYDPNVGKKLALYAFEKYGHICMPFEHSLVASVMRTALTQNVPLVAMGENPALVWGTKHTKATSDYLEVLNNNTNAGMLDPNLWQTGDIPAHKLTPYTFPSLESINKADLRAIYLQYYTREYSPVYNADFSVARGLKGRYRDTPEEIGRYRIFSSIDDDLMIPNEMLKYYKNGFGRAHDDVVTDLREGRLSRNEAICLIEKYDGLCDEKFVKYTCKYLGISEEYFWEIVDKWVNKKLFEKNVQGKWIPKFTVGEDFKQ